MTLPCFSSTDKTQHHHWSCQTSQGPEFADYKNTSGVKGSTKTNLCRPNPPTRHWGPQGIQNHHENTSRKTMEKPNFWRLFFPFNLFHKNCSSVHFWWAGQDLVVLSTLERPQHQAFSCLPKKSPTPSIPVGKSQLRTFPHPLLAQPSQQPGPQQSKIFQRQGCRELHLRYTLQPLVKT